MTAAAASDPPITTSSSASEETPRPILYLLHVQESNMSREASVYPGSGTISRRNFSTSLSHRRNVARIIGKKNFVRTTILCRALSIT
jgi:hypothetical protein